MSFDLTGAKNNLITLLGGTTGLQAIYDGAPESMPTRTACQQSLTLPRW